MSGSGARRSRRVGRRSGGLGVESRKTLRSWRGTAVEMVVLGMAVALLSRRGSGAADALGILAGCVTAAGGGFVWFMGLLRLRESSPDVMVLGARAASVTLAALIVVAAVVTGAYVRLA